MIQPSDLRTAFPEFASAITYPDTQVTFWITQAYAQINAARFGTQLDLGIMLFVAHNIVLSAQAARVAAAGGAVGSPSGIAASKSVGSVAVSYDTALTASAGAGYWNATSYGQRFWTMLKSFSLGPVYVPGSSAPLGNPWGYPNYGYRPF